MRRLRLEGESKRLAGAEQVGLPNHFIQRPWPQHLGQRRMHERLDGAQEITPRQRLPLSGEQNGTGSSADEHYARTDRIAA